MFSKEEAVYQIFKQPGIRQAPPAPSGVLIPGEASWDAKHGRSKLENAQVQSDGFKREFALGNHTSTAGGSIIYNLNLLGYWLNALCDGLTSAAFGGVLSVAVTNGGSGYTEPPTVGFTGAGTGAAAVAIVVGGSVVGVVVTNPGTGYTAASTVAFTGGGGGTGAAATATVNAAKFIHTGTLNTGSPFYHLVEKGIVGQAYFRRFFDLVLRKMSFSENVEGIGSISDEWVGTGQKTKAATSLDATPAEVTGVPVEYANLCLLEGGTTAGILKDLTIDVECQLLEKRPPLAIQGKATELRRGGWTVTGSGNAWFENDDLATKFENGTLTSLLSVCSSPDGAFLKNLPEVKFELSDWERTDDGIMVPLTYESIKKASSAAPIAFTLINDTATYPS